MTRAAARKKRGAPKAPRRPLSPAFLAAIRKQARVFFREARGSHDWDHTERVYRLCERIGRKERADLGILRLAAVLHDIGRREEDRTSGRICHGQAGAAMARALLAKHGLDAITIRAVVHCIRTHRFRKRAVPRTLEARILFDADKLDSIGAVGIGRAFLFAGEVGARLHDKDIDVRRTKPYTREDTAYREYLVKLGRVRERIFTREGKRIAAERPRYMVGFFARLNKETDGIL
ncbi:MAG: HD domain-containing protein [Candidatus Aminicenantales bacterium]